MKNITFSADDSLIAQARGLAQARGRTLNDEFRLWLADYAAQHGQAHIAAQTRRLLDELTAPSDEASPIPDGYRWAPLDARPAVRGALTEREQRMVARIDGEPAAPGRS